MNLLTYPLRPINGGKFELKRPDLVPTDYEPKLNDHRLMVHLPSLSMWNRHGDIKSDAADFNLAIEYLLKVIGKDADNPHWEWLDCLSMGQRTPIAKGSLFLIDLPNCPYTCRERGGVIRSRINMLLSGDTPEDNMVYTPQRWIQPSPVELQAVWSVLQQENQRLGCEFYEGLVGKLAHTLYKHQLRDPEKKFSGWQKFRFL